MSKLAERIRRATRAEAHPIGFGALSRRSSNPSMLLVARLPAERADRIPQAVEQGADVILLEVADPGQLKDKLEQAGDVPCGVRLAGAAGHSLAALKERGIDFLVLDGGESAAETLLEEGLGFVLALGADTSDVVLRVVEHLPLDALLVPPWEGSLTVQRQIELHRFHLLSRTPLLVEAEAEVTAEQLRCLRDAGVVGIILDGEKAWGRLADLHQAIAALPPRRGREERPEAILPLTPSPTPQEEEEEFP